MDPVSALVTQLGLGVAANAIYDFARTAIHRGGANRNTLAEDLRSRIPSLTIDGATVLADTVIDVFAGRGDIEIRGSALFAKNAIGMRSTTGTKFVFGDGSSSVTDRSRIDAGRGATIEGAGGGGIRQNEDGSISFFT